MFVNKITAHLVRRTSSQRPSQWDLFGIYISTWTWNSMTMNHRAIMAYEDEICQMPQQKSASAIIKVRGYFREKNQATTVTTPPNRLQQHYLGTKDGRTQINGILMTEIKPQLTSLCITPLQDRMEENLHTLAQEPALHQERLRLVESLPFSGSQVSLVLQQEDETSNL